MKHILKKRSSKFVTDFFKCLGIIACTALSSCNDENDNKEKAQQKEIKHTQEEQPKQETKQPQNLANRDQNTQKVLALIKANQGAEQWRDLLEDIDVNAVDQNGCTLLILAVYFCPEASDVEILLNHPGIEINQIVEIDNDDGSYIKMTVLDLTYNEYSRKYIRDYQSKINLLLYKGAKSANEITVVS